MGASITVQEIQENARWTPAVNPWLIAISVIIPTFMEVLDTTIANVALTHIAGSMSASYSEATWVLTSYLISNAVVLPLTAWLGNRFQRKRFLLACIFVFTLASLLCGLSVNLPMLLTMRIIQGLGGGGLAPISQAILMESFPPNKQGAANALFGLGVVVAPVIGPILGGWLTDNYSWRWIFYINIPLGALGMWAVQKTVEDPPWVRDSNPGPLDGLGFAALALWLGCQEVFLDKGQENDWFASGFIRWMALLAVVGFIIFVAREIRAEKPMVDLRIFRHRNFSVCVLLMFFTTFLLYAIGLVNPQFLQQMMGYSALAAGIVTSPLGLGAMVSMILVGQLVTRMDQRIILIFGFFVFAFAAWQLSHIYLGIAPTTVFWPQILAGSAIGFLFVPINVAGTAQLRRDEMGSATGMLNLVRNVGGSVGIAMVSTFIARRSQVHQTTLAAAINPGNIHLLRQVSGVHSYLFQHLPATAATLQSTLGLVYLQVQQQAYLLAFVDVYQGLALVGALSALLVLLVRKVRGKPVLH